MDRAARKRARVWGNCAWSIFSGSKAREKFRCFFIVLRAKVPHNYSMKTRFGLPRLAGWTGRCGVALVALTFCASALADPSKNVVATPKVQASKMQTATQQEVTKKLYFVFTGGSAIPQPIDRVSGPIPTTASPMLVFGNFSGE
jgi:hypothetical protein